MSERSTITASITPELNASIAGRLTPGWSANVGKAIRAALRLMEQHEPDLTVMQGRQADDVAGGR